MLCGDSNQGQITTLYFGILLVSLVIDLLSSAQQETSTDVLVSVSSIEQI